MSGAVHLARNLEALASVGMPPAALGAADGDVISTIGERVVDVQVRTETGLTALDDVPDPVGDWARLIPESAANASLVALAGAGAGYGIEALLRMQPRGRILVLEPSPTACVAALSRRDWAPLIRQRRLGWLVGPDYPGWVDAWSWVQPGEVPTVVIHPVLGRVRGADVRQALETLRRIVANASANDRARQQFAAPYLLNTLHNLPHLLASRDAGELAGRFTGCPLVLLAAGPSLNANLERLAPVRDRAIVMAVDTALRPCLAAGVAPDFVVALDPGQPNLRHLSVGTAPARTWLVAEPSVAPGSFEPFGDRCFTFRVGDHEPWPLLLREGLARTTLSAWGSVLTAALDLAVRTGAAPLVLLGADFAFTAGQPYCRGTVYEEEWGRWQAEGQTLEAIWQWWLDRASLEEEALDGTRVRTTPQLAAFRDWISDYCRRSGGVILNGTGAGILRDVASCDVASVLANYPCLDQFPIVAAQTRRSRVSIAAPALTDPLAEPWSRWQALTGTSLLTLVRLVSSASTQAPGTASADMPVDETPAALAVSAWKRLHAARYYETHPRYQNIFDDIGIATIRRLADLRPKDTLLEIGCGYGRVLWHLVPSVQEAVGIDVAPEPLMLARLLLRDRGPVELLLGDGLSLDVVGHRRFTIIVALTAFQFMARSAVSHHLRDIARVLAPGGRACLQFHHDGPGHGVPDAARDGARFEKPTHVLVSSYDAPDIVEELEAAGLRALAMERHSLDAYHPGQGYGWWWVLCEAARPGSDS